MRPSLGAGRHGREGAFSVRRRAGTAYFRQVLAQVPTPVCVVTAAAPDGPVGVTVGSFTSVSLDPPLVVFYCGLASASARAIVATGRFRVNVLAEDQEQVCAAFASRTADRFATGSWETPHGEPPRLGGASAWIDCTLEESRPAGDHVEVVGRVLALDAPAAPRRPLVFHNGQLVRLDRARQMHAPGHPFDWWGI